MYRRSSKRVTEDSGTEKAITEGGYGHRQLFELVQNAADAIQRAGADDPMDHGGRIDVVLTGSTLYCANEGQPIQESGVESILFSNMSDKRGDEIGHFGLGFKSVLAVSKNPAFISRSGSFRFDVEQARRRILEIVPGATGTPGLRLAEPFDPLAAARTDSTLAGLMEWAASVVVLPRDGERAALLSADLETFPREFILFSGHVGSLTLTDTEASVSRRITTAVNPDGVITLTENGEVSRWRVFKTNHEPTPAARQDGGTIAGRETVPVAWAVPLDIRMARGEFWAFFPTNYQCSLSGIVNAAWKTNADRQNLLEGPYNQELLAVAAGLVVENLPLLVRPEDPGNILDLLPARDTANRADERLSGLVYAGLGDVRCLADTAGTPPASGELTLLPRDIPESGLKTWAALGDWPAGWAHGSAGTRERYPRAARIGARESGSIESWLESVADGDDPSFSIDALLLAGSLAPDPGGFPRAHAARKAKIVMASDGELYAADQDRMFLSSEYVSADSAVAIVHPTVQAHGEAADILTKLGIVALAPLEELRRTGAAIDRGMVDWDRFWQLVREAGPERPEVRGLLRDTYRYGLQLRNEAGEFRPYFELLLPGAVALSGEDRRVALDLVYHRQELGLIEAATGIADVPVSALDVKHEAWFKEFETAAMREYVLGLPPNSPRPQLALVAFANSAPKEAACRLGPLLSITTPEFKARFTVAALRVAANDRGWLVRHKTQRHYPESASVPPTHWVLRRHGYLPTSLGPMPVAECVSEELQDWLDLVPVADRAEPFLHLPRRLESLPQDAFERACQRALRIDDAAQVGSFYGSAAEASRPDGGPAFQPPERIRCRARDGFEVVAPGEATVAPDRETLELLCAGGSRAVLCLGEAAAAALVKRWSLQPPAEVEVLPVQWTESGGEPGLLRELYPGLPPITLDGSGSIECVPCSAIWQERRGRSGSYREELQSCRVHDRIMVLETLDDRQRLALLNRALNLGLAPNQIEATLEHLEKLNSSLLAEQIRAAPTTEARLALALGPELLRGLVPAHVLDVVDAHGKLGNTEDLARLALAVRDVAILQDTRGGLQSRGLDAPSRWRGTPRAIDFVRDLGFPEAFAGQPASDDPPWIDVDGPTMLRPLHEFQLTVSRNIRSFLEGPVDRGMLSLPTGAGKTRVMSETLVRAYADGTLKGPALWLADRQELCDQAVESWREVWRAFGPQRQRLRISRFWGRTNDNLANLGDKPHLVVATYQTTSRRLTAQYEWLRNCSVIVVDEAHGSIAPTYTDILSWLGLTSRQTDRFLIGLTATPFRGRSHDDEETRRLVARFGQRRFDFGTFEDDDPYPALQRMGVLSEVDHEIVQGTSVELNESEMESLRQYRVLPSSAEERLGHDATRNEYLLRVIQALDPQWPVVVFATSVGHSQLLAGLLSLRGVPARAIWGEMDPWARRHSIEAFRAGEVRVLVNYGVLTTGFDAPKTRAIIVARPVFSPGLYQQMIGRGLRGPRNGGTDRCLIVNVEDNVLEYGEELAFRHFEHLWRH